MTQSVTVMQKAKSLGCYLPQGQGNSAGSHSKKITVSSTSPELLSKPFTIRFGIVVHHHESNEAWCDNVGLLSSKSRSQ